MHKIVLWFCGIMLAAGTLSAAPAPGQLDAAVKYYQRMQVDGFCVGLKLHGVAVTPAQRQQIALLSAGFIRDTVLPVLKKHRLEETWIKSVNDPGLRALQAQTLKNDNEKELRKTIGEIIKLMNEKYPVLVNTVFADPEYQAGFQKLLKDLRSAVNIPKKQ